MEKSARVLSAQDFWRLRGIIIVASLGSALDSVLQHVFLPYARTLTACDSPPDDAELADVHSRQWSGSALCNDREEVARNAQANVNLAHGIALLLCCVVLPFFGVAADRIGRWTVLGIFYGGIAVMCVVNARFPTEVVFVASRSLSGLLGDPHPIQHAQVADVCGAETRGSCFAVVIVLKMIIGAVAGFLSNFQIVGKHLYDYTATWLVCAGVASFATLSTFVFEETRPSLKAAPAPAITLSQAAGEAVGGMRAALAILGKPTLRSTITIIVLTIVGIVGPWSVAPAFAIIVYAWPQEQFGYVMLAVIPLALLGMTASTAVIRTIGQARYLAVGQALQLSSIVCLALAEVHAAFLYGAVVLLMISISAAPVLMAAITTCVPADDQAKAQGAISAVFHATAAVTLVVYAFIWKAQAVIGLRSLPFWVGTGFMACAVGLAAVSGTWARLTEEGSVAHDLQHVGPSSYKNAVADGVELEQNRRRTDAPVDEAARLM